MLLRDQFQTGLRRPIGAPFVALFGLGGDVEDLEGGAEDTAGVGGGLVGAELGGAEGGTFGVARDSGAYSP